MRVNKYVLDLLPIQKVRMPPGARVLHVGVSAGYPAVWALVDGILPATDEHLIELYGTGQQLIEPHQHLDHLGTVQIDSYVWHLFHRQA